MTSLSLLFLLSTESCPLVSGRAYGVDAHSGAGASVRAHGDMQRLADDIVLSSSGDVSSVYETLLLTFDKIIKLLVQYKILVNL